MAKAKLYGVITGDIVHSRMAPDLWKPHLEEVLNQFGIVSKDWDIFRGDSFQLILDPSQILQAAISLRIKLICLDASMDARMGMGIGTVQSPSTKVIESQGEAFIKSGEAFESLREDVLWKFKGQSSFFDDTLNLVLSLTNELIIKFSANTAEAVYFSINNPEFSQETLGKKIGINQSAISKRLKRGHWLEIHEVLNWYKKHHPHLTQ